MNEVVEVVADWLIIAYAVFIFFFALVIVGVELMKERKPKNEPQSACSEEIKELKRENGVLKMTLERGEEIASNEHVKYVQALEENAQFKQRINELEGQSACSEDGARKENAIREVIHRLDNELKYGSIDEALSDTLETCVVRLKSLLPGEVQ